VLLAQGKAEEAEPYVQQALAGYRRMVETKRRELGPVDTDNNPIGGEVRLLASAEIRQSVWKAIGVVVFLDTGQVVVSSDLDGIHLDVSEHAKLGATVAARVRALLV